MKTPQIKPRCENGIWTYTDTNGRVHTILSQSRDCTKVENARAGYPCCPQCGHISHWVKGVAAECDTCEARWNETPTATERTSR